MVGGEGDKKKWMTVDRSSSCLGDLSVARGPGKKPSR